MSDVRCQVSLKKMYTYIFFVKNLNTNIFEIGDRGSVITGLPHLVCIDARIGFNINVNTYFHEEKEKQGQCN